MEIYDDLGQPDETLTAPKEYFERLDNAIETFRKYDDGDENKYYAGLVCKAAIELRIAGSLSG